MFLRILYLLSPKVRDSRASSPVTDSTEAPWLTVPDITGDRVQWAHAQARPECSRAYRVIKFFTKSLNRKFETKTSQAIGKQRMFLRAELYKDLTDSFIDKLLMNLNVFLNLKVILFVIVMEAFLAYLLRKQHVKSLMFLMIHI